MISCMQQSANPMNKPPTHVGKILVQCIDGRRTTPIPHLDRPFVRLQCRRIQILHSRGEDEKILLNFEYCTQDRRRAAGNEVVKLLQLLRSLLLTPSHPRPTAVGHNVRLLLFAKEALTHHVFLTHDDSSAGIGFRKVCLEVVFHFRHVLLHFYCDWFPCRLHSSQQQVRLMASNERYCGGFNSLPKY